MPASHAPSMLLALLALGLHEATCFQTGAFRFGGLRGSSRAPTMAIHQAAPHNAEQISRRAASLLAISFLPAFASVAHAREDSIVTFKKEIAGGDGPILVNEAVLKACSEDPDECGVGEIIARSIGMGDNALVLVTESDDTLEEIPFSFFKKTIYGRGGKFGAYGAPEDVKAVRDKTANGVRTLDIKWNTFTPGGSTLAKRSIVQAVAGEGEVCMLVCSTTSKNWKASEPTLSAIAASWQAKPTGKAAKKSAKIDGVGQSMFKKQNEDRVREQKEREAEGIF